LILLLSDLALQLKSCGQLAAWDRKVDWDKLEFSDVGCAGNRFFVSRVNALLNILDYFGIFAGLVRSLKINAELLFEEVYSFNHQILAWLRSFWVNINLESYNAGHESLHLANHHDV
jgi:hypothetical protein